MIRRAAKGSMVALVVLLVLAGAALPEEGRDGHVHQVFSPLIERLGRDGYDPGLLERLYGDPRAAYLSRAVAFNLKRIERAADYSHFLSEKSLQDGLKFYRLHRTLLEDTESRYGVPVEELVAILYVESRFGRDTGRYSVFNVYSSLALAEEPQHFSYALSRLKERYPGTTQAEIRRRARRKAAWAYGELKALLRLAAERDMDVHEVKGSWAGAFGMPQFIPSSFAIYAVDGDGDGRVDLDVPADASASVGAYLKRHGWKEGLSRTQKVKVLRTYNNSSLYANTILDYAVRLRKLR